MHEQLVRRHLQDHIVGHISRDATEIEQWKGKDPIAPLERQLREQNELDDTRLREIEDEIMAALDAAATFAEASPFPTPEQATDDVFAA